MSGSSLQLTNGQPYEAASAFFSTPVNVAQFSTQFTFQLTNANADGFTFTIQNDGTTALGPDGGGLGYGPDTAGGSGGIPNSVAVKFDLYSNNGEGPDSTGLYTDGAAPTNIGSIDLSSTGINLHSGDVFQANLSYNGSTLTETLTDTQTNATVTETYTVNIGQTVGSSTAYVGFTAGTGGLTATQNILTWTYSSGSQVPTAPGNLVAMASGTTIGLSWSAATGATSYNVYRGTSAGGEGTTAYETGVTGTSFSDTGLSPGSTYYYFVTAVNGAGESGHSSETSATTVPTAPGNLVATASGTTIGLSWSAATGATSYNVYRGTSAGGEGTTAYETGVTGTSFSDTGLSPGSTYYYFVTAVNGAGESGHSSETSATTVGSQVPTAPGNLVATASGTTIGLSWSAATGATSYNVYRGTSAGGEGTTAYETGVTGTSFSDTGLSPGSTYYYFVTAVNAAGESGHSSETSATTVAASKLVFGQQPTNATAGVAISPAVTVEVEDASGNVVTSDSSTVTVTLSSGTFASGSSTATATASSGVATFSGLVIDTAGSYTLAASDGSLTGATSNSLTISPAAASKLVFGQQPSNATAGVAISPAVTVKVEDASGNVVTSDSSTVTLTLSSGTFASGSSTATATASSGVATFSGLVIDTAGSYTLAASDGSLTNATSNSLTISPAAASKLVFGQQPSNATAGVAISPAVTVEVEDAYGNVVTSNSSTVTLKLSSGTFASGSSTATASKGVATFSGLKIDTAGSYTLAASDGSLTGAISNSLTISPAAASKLVFGQQPTNATAGVAISPAVTVEVEDAYGNVVTSNSSTVTLKLSSGTFASGSSTATATVSSGVATFSGLVIDTAGTYTLKATDGSLTGATSNSLTISPAAASKLVFGQQPTNAAAGVAISPAVTVKVEDAFGNVVTSNSSTVTLTLSSGTFASGSSTAAATASNGVATFSGLVIDTAGSYTLAASDGSLTGATSNSLTISPAAASKLVFGQQPTNATAGVAISPAVTVKVEDAFGNVVTSNSSTLTLTLSSGTFASGSSTATATASKGVATFSGLKIDTAGSYTLAASDGSLTGATSNSLAISPAAASKLVFGQQPTNATAGVAISPAVTVEVEDAYGNVVTSNSSTVTLKLSSGTFASGSSTATATVSSGVATFSGLVIDTAGSYTLKATDGSLTSATSNSFTIS